MKNALNGLRSHDSYHRWRHMMARCYDSEQKGYGNYGGRGIRVAQEWHDMATFITYVDTVLGPRPAGYSIDRIDNDGNYEPGNIRWADVSTQNRNRRKKVEQ